MNAIEIKRGIEVKVNSKGETIIIDVEDQLFVDKFYSVIGLLDKAAEHMKKAEVKKLSEREQLQEMIRLTREIMGDIDSLFGKDACKKVFGDIVPNPYLIAEFFDQMTPIAEQYMDERQKKIAKKYSERQKNGRGGSKYRTKEQIIQDNMR